MALIDGPVGLAQRLDHAVIGDQRADRGKSASRQNWRLLSPIGVAEIAADAQNIGSLSADF
jgi:hypothetical protein